MSTSNHTPTQTQSSPSRIYRFFQFLFAFCLLLAIGIGAAGYYVYVNLQPMPDQGEPKRVEIPTGSTAVAISHMLKEEEIVRNDLIFRYYAQYKGVAQRFQAGTYLFTSGMTIDQVIEKLINGDVYIETVKFTIPEGFTVQKIADHLTEQGLINKNTFLTLVNEGQFDYEFVKQIPSNRDIKYRLEGYLFPNTYEIKKGSTEYEIIDRMLAEFQKQLPPEWEKIFSEQGWTLHEGLTLASIIERETIVKKELPIVAGVFYNRLSNGWMMQSDATVQYASGDWKGRLYFKDLEVDDSYNTFIVKGLPPGPVSNPGQAAIEAAAFPEKHDFYFFVTKKDGSNEHYFTKTFEEHRSMDAASRKNDQ
jgi:UPF0755 protein